MVIIMLSEDETTEHVPVAVKVIVTEPAALSALLGVYCSESEVAGEGKKVPVPDVVQR